MAAFFASVQPINLEKMMRTAMNFVLGAVVGFGVSYAAAVLADQPRMQSALDHLLAAETELQATTSDKGGHRASALKHTREAIEQTRKGIAFDRRH
jgi:hypothetical protein